MTVSTRTTSRHRPAGPGFEDRGRTPLPALRYRVRKLGIEPRQPKAG